MCRQALLSRALRENTNKRVGEAALVAHWTMGVSVPWRGSGISGIGRYNWALQVCRLPGSAFNPVLHAAGPGSAYVAERCVRWPPSNLRGMGAGEL